MCECRNLVETAVNAAIDQSRCSELFGDIMRTSHVREVPWCHASRGSNTVLADAQGAMLVLHRVRDLVGQGVFDAGCNQRADKVDALLRDVCENELNDVSLEGFDAKQRLAEIARNRDQGKVDSRGRKGLREREGVQEERETADDAYKHGSEASLEKGSMDRVRRERSATGQQPGSEDSVGVITHEKQPDVHKQCANIHCKNPSKPFKLICVQCQAGGQDWKQHWDKYFCFGCYNQYRLHGNFDRGVSTTGKNKRGQVQSTEDVRSDQSANERSKEAQTSKHVERPDKRGDASEDRCMREDKKRRTAHDRADDQDKQNEAAACEPPRLVRPGASPTQASKPVKVPPKNKSSGDSNEAASKEISRRILIHMPVKGMDGRNCVSRVSTSDKLELMFRSGSLVPCISPAFTYFAFMFCS
jgi:hypothetical protein